MAMVHNVIDFSTLMKFILIRELMSDVDQLFVVFFLTISLFFLVWNSIGSFQSWVPPPRPFTHYELALPSGGGYTQTGSAIGTTWKADLGCSDRLVRFNCGFGRMVVLSCSRFTRSISS